MKRAFVIGLGYSAAPFAERLAGEGWQVTATTRSAGKAEAIRTKGISPLLWEAPDRLPEAPLEDADLLLVSTGPSGGSCPAADAVPEGAIGAGTRILYLSSSGVYGDHGGGWIDESAECRPGTERGKDRLAAEAQWTRIAESRGAPLTLCRLAGIYGPGRSAVDSLRGDTPGARAGLSRRLVKPGQVFNRIHRDDIAAGLHALLGSAEVPGIVNFADDEPSPPGEVIEYAAGLLGIDPPPEVAYEDVREELSPMARSFYAEKKRLENRRLKALVGRLLYPTYREGLTAIARS